MFLSLILMAFEIIKMDNYAARSHNWINAGPFLSYFYTGDPNSSSAPSYASYETA
jgi:uncharacterized membrane protein YkgB